MLPDKFDPRWKKIVENPEEYKNKVNTLATQLLFSGLKIQKNSASLDQKINTAYNFFKKNENTVPDDINALFNREKL